MANPPDNLEVTENNPAANGCSSEDATLANELPPELLAYIFDMAQDMLLPSEDLFRRFPFILGQVSRYWRQVTFGAPMLWSNVDISQPRDLTALQVYLGRSKDYPIDLHFFYDITLAPNEKADPDVSPLINILRPHYYRCRSIRLRSGVYPETTPEIMGILESMCNGNFPMLQCFLVEGSEMGDTIEPHAIVNNSPNLASVRLGGRGLSYCRPPLSVVTELHLAVANNAIAYADFSEMLRSCAELLVTLCVYDDLVFGWPAGLLLTHDMPSLRYLRIFGNMLAVSQLLLSISAPDLQELTIAPVVLNDLTTLGEISHRRKVPRFPALKSLTLAPAHSDAMETTLRLAYTCFPGIELLILPNYYKECFIESFMTGDGAEAHPLWPELGGLAVRDIDEGWDQGILYRFIEDRLRLGVPLRTLYLDPLSMPRMTRMDWLKDHLVFVVEGDPWQIQCADAFYSDEESRFLGSDE